jgi:hypothetical protein
VKLRLSRLKDNRCFMEHLRLDVAPDVFFRPRFVGGEDMVEERIKETQGFSFYVEAMGEDGPGLMVMKTYRLTSKTLGEVEGVPGGLLAAALSAPGAREVGGMYPMDEALAAWVRKELGLTS